MAQRATEYRDDRDCEIDLIRAILLGGKHPEEKVAHLRVRLHVLLGAPDPDPDPDPDVEEFSKLFDDLLASAGLSLSVFLSLVCCTFN